MKDIIKIEGLSKAFGDVKAVQDLSFRVREGELFAFLGVNGAGKSTTINILCGQLSKDSGQLVSSLLAVSCVTVAFCSNFLMVQDKANGTIKDLRISPVKRSTLSLSYYIAALLSTLLICLVATGLCLGYLAATGWYLTFSDVVCLLLDVVLLVLFGTALSSAINLFLSSQGQISAVGTIVSSGYGFICGAYMPISSFSSGLQKVISFLPGTYGTALVRNHAMQSALAEMEKEGIPVQLIEELKNALDCNLYFFEKQVSIPAMYGILVVTITALIAVYVLLNKLQNKKSR